jgi:hypothetical protein
MRLDALVADHWHRDLLGCPQPFTNPDHHSRNDIPVLNLGPGPPAHPNGARDLCTLNLLFVLC